MNYEDMSDFVINGHVSMHEHGFSWVEFDDDMASHVRCGNAGSHGFAIVEVKDYCHGQPDAWKFMDEYKIVLTFVNGLWRASSVLFGYHEHSSKNLCRAVMIVYLKIKGEK